MHLPIQDISVWSPVLSLFHLGQACGGGSDVGGGGLHGGGQHHFIKLHPSSILSPQ